MPEFKNPNPPFAPAPPYDVVPSPNVPRPRHRKWIVHSHEATKPAHSDSMSDINITPLIDVMLVLLIIFMVVTPLAQKGLDIALPQASPPQPLNAPPPCGAGPRRSSCSPTGSFFTTAGASPTSRSAATYPRP